MFRDKSPAQRFFLFKSLDTLIDYILAKFFKRMFCLIDYYQLTTSVARKSKKKDNTIDTVAMRKNQKKATELREFVTNTNNHFKLLDQSRKKQEKDKEFVDFVKEHYKLK